MVTRSVISLNAQLHTLQIWNCSVQGRFSSRGKTPSSHGFAVHGLLFLYSQPRWVLSFRGYRERQFVCPNSILETFAQRPILTIRTVMKFLYAHSFATLFSHIFRTSTVIHLWFVSLVAIIAHVHLNRASLIRELIETAFHTLYSLSV